MTVLAAVPDAPPTDDPYLDDAPIEAMPSDITAEQQVLGAVLIAGPRVLDEIALDPAMLYRPAHAEIATAVLALAADREPIDPLTVGDRLAAAGARDPIGVARYLHALVAGCLTTANVRYHWELVIDAAARRTVIQTGLVLVDRARDTTLPREQTVERARATLDTLAEQVHPTGTAPTIGDVLPGWLTSLETAVDVISTGWDDIDDILGGWYPGCLYVISARPGGGKSLLGQQASLTAAQHGPVLFHSLEMSEHEFAARSVAQTARIPYKRLQARAGRPVELTDQERRAATKAMTTLDALPLVLDCTPGVTIGQIHSKARSVRRTHGRLTMVTIDYLQLVTPTVTGRNTNREQEVAAISRAAKLMAKDLGIPVLIIAQLNRQSEARGDRRPRVSDIRESGAIEQDADAILLLHREDDDEQARGEVDVIVGKNRHGSTGTVQLAWQAHYARLAGLGEGFTRP